MNSRKRARQIARLIERDGDCCAYCALTLGPGLRTLEHVVPLWMGGSLGGLDNLLLACRPCNERKNDRTDEEFRADPWLAERRAAVGASVVQPSAA